MTKRIVRALFAGVIIILCAFSLLSCEMKEILPESSGELTTIKLGIVRGGYPNGPIKLTLKNKDSGETYSIVFSKANSHSRTINIESGTYLVEDVELSEIEYKAFFCTLDEITETYVLSDEELSKIQKSEELQKEMKEYGAEWDGDHTVTLKYDKYVFKDTVDIVSGESYTYYISMAVKGTTFKTLIQSNAITIILVISCCLALIIFKIAKKKRR